MNRAQKKLILKDLPDKMVFITGPRQTGKTWIAKEIAKEFERSLYLNYDNLEDREMIENQSWLDDVELLIFDELHKMKDWKNYIKGVFDKKGDNQKIIVTGSARLDAFRQAGDSLAGRFFRHRLLPITPSEAKGEIPFESLDPFIIRGGFPEPFLSESDTHADRWRMQYVDSLIRTDVLDFENIHNFKSIQMVFEILRRRVGSPVSYSSIARDVGSAPNTVKKYIQILEELYIVFRVTPHSRNIARSILKEPKIYFFDTGLVTGDEGAKFENLTALSLLKYVYAINDYKGKPYSLNYIRTKDNEEVDFCIVNNNLPEKLIEVKTTSNDIPKSLLKIHQRYSIPAMLLVKNLKMEKKVGDIEIRRGLDFLKGLDF